MSAVSCPRLRPVESFPYSADGGEPLFVLRDPEGFAGAVVLPVAGAILASLMDGSRSLMQLQDEFRRQTGFPVALADLERLIGQLDERLLLDNDHFRARWKQELELYLNAPVRPAAHAGGAYESDPAELRTQLAGLFTHEKGPGAPGDGAAPSAPSELRGVLSPHIDLHRGGPAFAWAYKQVVEESQADLFVVFGTAHRWMANPFSISRKDFATPLGTVPTDRELAARLAAVLAETPAGRKLDLFADELAHRQEHSIEFQALFLQYLLGGRRPFRLLPILVGSFHEYVASGQQPADSPEIAAFCAALRKVVDECPGRVCFVTGGDLAHIGQRFGDRELLTPERLHEQSLDDQELLAKACAGDAAGFFSHVADREDRARICGLSPLYTMLQVMRPARGQFLIYDQAVEPDGTSCVSFGSLAFYGRG